MGFREDAIEFKRGLPEVLKLPVEVKNIGQAPELMEEALALKNMLDPRQAGSPAHRYEEIKIALGMLSGLAGVAGFRHGRIAFTAIERQTAAGTSYIVRSIEVLPE